jgi:mRNA-degrading endonuclease toxin of MazEF toxin-antitoxin module
MKVKRGDVVIVDHPFSDASGANGRPVLVVQADSRNAILTNTIVAMITKNVTRIGIDPTQLLIDISTPDGQLSGLTTNSAATCGNLFTVHEDRIRKKIGELSDAPMQRINDCHKAALALP